MENNIQKSNYCKIPRRQALMHLFDLSSKKYGVSDISKMKFFSGDTGADPLRSPMYTVCYNKNTNPEWEEFCGPDGFFYKWEMQRNFLSCFEWEFIVKQIVEESEKNPTIDKTAWFGNIHTTKKAKEGHTRLNLKKIGDQNKKLFDIVQSSKKNYKTMSDQVRDYRFLIDVGGHGYSGRLKYLLFSKRPLLLIDRFHVEFFHSKLQPFRHYIPVKNDLSDLLEKENWARENESESLKIATNAFEFAKENFTQGKIIERIFKVYNSLKDIK